MFLEAPATAGGTGRLGGPGHFPRAQAGPARLRMGDVQGQPGAQERLLEADAQQVLKILPGLGSRPAGAGAPTPEALKEILEGATPEIEASEVEPLPPGLGPGLNARAVGIPELVVILPFFRI